MVLETSVKRSAICHTVVVVASALSLNLPRYDAPYRLVNKSNGVSLVCREGTSADAAVGVNYFSF